MRSIPDAVALPLVLGGAAVLAADVARRAYRSNQLFCPEREPVRSWDPADYGIPAGATEERWIETPDGQRLHAWYCRTAAPRASALFCHGNTGNLTTSADMIPHLLSAGLNVLFFDYRGFGRSSGRPSFRGVVADGLTAARVHRSLAPEGLPSVLYGFSLGGAVAAQVLRRHPFDGLILQSTFTSLTDITRVLYPTVPMHLLAGRAFDTLRVVRRLRIPLLVLHGSEDEVIPVWMARRIAAACSAPSRLYCVAGGLHKDLFTRDPGSLTRQVSDFLDSLPSPVRAWLRDEPRTTRALRAVLRRSRSR